eukprot:9259015-Alexandrium_andersonii.AAC.1
MHVAVGGSNHLREEQHACAPMRIDAARDEAWTTNTCRHVFGDPESIEAFTVWSCLGMCTCVMVRVPVVRVADVSSGLALFVCMPTC